jgi:hypothetical protein
MCEFVIVSVTWSLQFKFIVDAAHLALSSPPTATAPSTSSSSSSNNDNISTILLQCSSLPSSASSSSMAGNGAVEALQWSLPLHVAVNQSFNALRHPIHRVTHLPIASSLLPK